TCEKVLDLMCYMVLPIQDGGKSQEEPSKVKPKFRKGSDLKLLPCTSKAIMPYCLHLMLACFKAPHCNSRHHQRREGGLSPGHGAPGLPLWRESDGGSAQILH
ncbi:INTS10 isoform 1, partial [Pan troglodytes]